jgi:hypothetical protein
VTRPREQMRAGSLAPADGRTQTLDRIRAVGLGLLRFGLALLLMMIGSFKFFAFEAEGIKPLVGSSPCSPGSMISLASAAPRRWGGWAWNRHRPVS